MSRSSAVDNVESLIVDMRNNYIEDSDECRFRLLRLLETVTLYNIDIYSCIVMGKDVCLAALCTTETWGHNLQGAHIQTVLGQWRGQP